MKVKELKTKLNELSPEYDEYDIVFGECSYGQPLKKIQILVKKIFLSFF